jgi:serine/threonine-protein kinase
MARPSAESIAQRAFDLGLLSETQLQEVWGALGSRSAPLEDLVQLLVRRELLTNYQVDKLLKGDKTGFFLGNYKVLYLVGTGTFARVFRAVKKVSGQVVAVKVLRSRFSDNPIQYGLFVREGELGRTLRHPNIVPIHEVFSERPTHFFVMDFVEGQNLREFVKQRKILRPAEAARIMSDVTRGLQYAFERAVTHRDLKLSNVLISSRGQAKLVDFGLAAMDDVIVQSQDIELPNTRAIDYAALERATGVRRDDTRSDIYFAGCMFYQMLSGVPAMVESKDRMARLNKSRFTDVVPIQKTAPQLPHYLTFVVKKAMDLDPHRRYQTPGDMLADLELAEKRLGSEPNGSNGKGGAPAGYRPDEPPPEDTDQQPAVMVIEPRTAMQDVFRAELKKAGYRVLLTGDPSRAVERLRKEPQLVGCALFNAEGLGQSALAAFNQLGDEQETMSLPAVLLLRAQQQSWTAQARTSDRRVVLLMPLKMSRLCETLSKLIPAAQTAKSGG